MPRVFSIFSIVAALAVCGYLFTAQRYQPASKQVNRAVDEAQSAAAGINLQQAATAIEQQHAETGTYAAADLARFGGVFVARGGAASYCIQLGVDRFAFHLSGPGGSPQPGDC